MLETLALLALALAVLGVVGSAVPALPGAVFSLSAVYLYWWSTGYADPGALALAAFTLVGLLTVAVDWFAGAAAARVGGASVTTTALAALAGFVLLFVAGPLGIVVGVAGTVFAVEFYRNRDAEASGRTALYATVGVLGSAVVQVLLTASILVGLVVVVAF
jgi:hypothetical protein